MVHQIFLVKLFQGHFISKFQKKSKNGKLKLNGLHQKYPSD